VPILNTASSLPACCWPLSYTIIIIIIIIIIIANIFYDALKVDDDGRIVGATILYHQLGE